MVVDDAYKQKVLVILARQQYNDNVCIPSLSVKTITACPGCRLLSLHLHWRFKPASWKTEFFLKPLGQLRRNPRYLKHVIIRIAMQWVGRYLCD